MTIITSEPTAELIQHEGKRAVRVRCRKCGSLAIGNLTKAEVLAAFEKLNQPAECPGFHVELGGWDYYWRLDEALALAFPE